MSCSRHAAKRTIALLDHKKELVHDEDSPLLCLFSWAPGSDPDRVLFTFD